MLNVSYNTGSNILFTSDYASHEIIDEIRNILLCKSCSIQTLYRRQLKKEISDDTFLNDSLYSLLRLENIIDSYDDESFKTHICDSHIEFVKVNYMKIDIANHKFKHWSHELYYRNHLRKECKQYCRTKDNQISKQKISVKSETFKINIEKTNRLHIIKHRPYVDNNLKLKSCLKHNIIDTLQRQNVKFSEHNYEYNMIVYECAARIVRRNTESRYETARRMMEEQSDNL